MEPRFLTGDRAQSRPEVDADRIGVWGPVTAAAMCWCSGAIDKRIRCAACQVPLVSGFRNIQRLMRQDFVATNRAAFDQDRAARFRGGPPAMIPVADPDPMAASVLPTPDSWEWFSETGKRRAPAWSNEVTLRSVEMLMEYEPSAYLERISPTPLLMVVAAGDHLTPADLALEAYQRARAEEAGALARRPLRRLRQGLGGGRRRSPRLFLEHLDWRG